MNKTTVRLSEFTVEQLKQISRSSLRSPHSNPEGQGMERDFRILLLGGGRSPGSYIGRVSRPMVYSL